MKENFHFKQLQLHYINNHQKERDTKRYQSFGICSLQLPDRLSCIMRGYRPWNTINTTMGISLLVKNGNNNNNNKKCKVCWNFFYQSFGCTKAKFGLLTRRQSHSLVLITTLFQVRPKANREPCSNVGNNSMTERISEIWAGKLLILNVTCCPTVSLTPKMYQKRLTM